VHGIELGNSPGTLDFDFRGEAGVLLRHRGTEPFTIRKGDRIIQFIFTRIELPVFVEVDTLPPTLRADGGFGSTGMQGPGFGIEEYRAERLRWDIYFIKMAEAAAGLSNCLRGAQRDVDGRYLLDAQGEYVGANRRYGCVITKDRTAIATGFNSRTTECSERCGCVREQENILSGTANDRGCLHAEEVALQNHARTGGASLEGAISYANAEPCLKCSKFLMGCGISAIVVPTNTYPSNGLALLADAGVEIRRVDTHSKD